MTVRMYSSYDKRPCKVAPAGSRFAEDISLKYDERGNRIFYSKGKIDIYEKIQSFKDECNLELIVARCTASGDFSPLQRVQGFYADVSNMPKNLAEVYSSVSTAQRIFSELPQDVASKFSNFEDFLSSIGDEKRLAKIFGVDSSKKPSSESSTAKISDKEVKSDA